MLFLRKQFSLYKICLASSQVCSRNSSTYVRSDILTTSRAVQHNHLRAKFCLKSDVCSALSAVRADKSAPHTICWSKTALSKLATPSVSSFWHYSEVEVQKHRGFVFLFCEINAVECTGYDCVKCVIEQAKKTNKEYTQKRALDNEKEKIHRSFSVT